MQVFITIAVMCYNPFVFQLGADVIIHLKGIIKISYLTE